MAKTQPYDDYGDDYDRWFDEHEALYQSEIKAVKQLLPERGKGIEIGIGSGRFAKPLGITIGVEPSLAMREIALRRGLQCIDGVAEALPVPSQSFDFALFVTTVCFLDNVHKAFKEAWRILKPGGCVVIGLIDKESELGQAYQRRKAEDRFYRYAEFVSVDEVITALRQAGFDGFKCVQTLFPQKHTTPQQIQPCKPGYGEGAFVVIQAQKSSANLKSLTSD